MASLPDLAELAPFLRVLLVTDGVVTRILEAYFNEPIAVDVLSHSEERSDRAHPEIEAHVGDQILSRRVILRGRVTRRPYVYAASIVLSNCLPAQVRRGLVEERKGIGELLSAGRLETYRELISVRRRAAAEHALHLDMERHAAVVSRCYRIHLHGRPAMLIEEIFPEARFA